MPRDALDTHLGILCSEAERAAVALTTITEAQSWLAGLGLDPLAFSAMLSALAAEAREAEGMRGMQALRLEAAQVVGKELARGYLKDQRRARERLRAVAALADEATAALAQSHARLYTLPMDRLQGALSEVRVVRDDLEGRAAALTATEAGAEILAEMTAWEGRLRSAFEERNGAEHDLFVAGASARAVRLRLLVELRRLRNVWRNARVVAEEAFQPLEYELALAEWAQRRKRKADAQAEAETEPAEPQVEDASSPL